MKENHTVGEQDVDAARARHDGAQRFNGSLRESDLAAGGRRIKAMLPTTASRRIPLTTKRIGTRAPSPQRRSRS
jgi:hypothetical protein